MFIKTTIKYASKGGIELAVFKAFWEVLVEVLSFGLGVAELVLVRLLAVLLVDGLSLCRCPDPGVRIPISKYCVFPRPKC